MRNKTAGFILGVLQLAALLQAYHQWMAPFLSPTGEGFFQILQFLTGILSLLLLILPVAGLYLIYREKRWGFLLQAAFPLACIFFGITALPVVSLFYGSSIKLNALFIAWTNALVCSTAFWFFVSAHSRFATNSSVKALKNPKSIEPDNT